MDGNINQCCANVVNEKSYSYYPRLDSKTWYVYDHSFCTFSSFLPAIVLEKLTFDLLALFHSLNIVSIAR